MSEQNKIDGYKKLIQVIDDYKMEDMRAVKHTAEKQVFVMEFENKYHIAIDANDLSLGNGFWINLSARLGDMSIGTYGKKYNREVANNKQDAEEEILLKIAFCTGPYIFGDDYPREFFERFYSELKTYKPKYCDDLNKGLYFSMDNAVNIFNDYRGICEKYIKENCNDRARRRAENLRKEAERIEAEIARESPNA